jgi:hypothetical protein
MISGQRMTLTASSKFIPIGNLMFTAKNFASWRVGAFRLNRHAEDSRSPQKHFNLFIGHFPHLGLAESPP